MSALLSYGEVLVDFLPVNKPELSYSPMAGGAPANVAVAYAKLGGSSYFAGGVGDDVFGGMLHSQLAQAGVNTQYTATIPGAKTALVVVGLDENGERSFSFYRHDTADMRYERQYIESIDWQNIEIFHFCSNTLTNRVMHENTQYCLERAKNAGALSSFDVNLRQQLWSQPNNLPARVEQCIKASDLIKLSREEADYLALRAGMSYRGYLAKLLTLGVSLILVTDGAKPVQLITNHHVEAVNVPKITPVDTTAAGDSFIAGFLYSLSVLGQGVGLQSTLKTPELVRKAVLFGSKCGAYTCQQKGAFTALPRYQDI